MQTGSKFVGIRYIFKDIVCEFSGDSEVAGSYGGDVNAWAQAHLSQPVLQAKGLEKIERFEIDAHIGSDKLGWLRYIDRKTGRVSYSREHSVFS